MCVCTGVLFYHCRFKMFSKLKLELAFSISINGRQGCIEFFKNEEKI